MNILVVDDEQAYRVLLEDYLRPQGWSVHTASNGEEGLTRLRETKIDLIISDVYMPVMDGLKFQEARNAIPGCSQIPFLFVSAYSDDYTLLAVKILKDCGFMKKSKTVDELKEWIHYLTTPVDERPRSKPGTEEKLVRDIRHGGRDEGYRR
jgi:CheY-like chemotaxis protein